MVRPLIAFGVLLIVAIFGATAHQLLSARASLLRGAERQVAQFDTAFAEQTVRTIEAVDAALLRAQEALDAHRPAAEIDALLHSRADAMPQVAGLYLTTRDGTLRDGDGSANLGHPPPAALALLDAYAAHPAPEPRISVPTRAADGRAVAYLVRPLLAHDGTLLGLAIAGLDLDYFEGFYRSVRLAEHGSVALRRTDGTLLLRAPDMPAHPAAGTGTATPAALAAAGRHPGLTTAMEITDADGQPRLAALRTLIGYPLVVGVSVSKSAVLASWWRTAIVFTVVALAASIAIAVLIAMLVRRSREIGRVFDDMLHAKDAADAANLKLRQQMAEREQAEAALREAQRAEAIGQLTRGVAHDFNNLLAVVIGNIDLMTLTHRNDAGTLQRLATMRAAAERGATLTGQLMAFARRQPLQPRAVDLNDIVTTMHPLLVSAVGSRVRIELNLAERLPAAQVDPTQIELAILNLAINARDAMPTGGVLTLATAPCNLPSRPDSGILPSCGVALTVRDTGVGMPPDVLARAFEPFFTTKGPGRGSGLGLSQVHGLAYQSGGNVSLDSRPGAGTQITVRLPATVQSPVAAAALDAADSLTAQRRPARVLLVDDDAPVRETAGAVLRAQGYTVTEAPDAEAALERLRAAGGMFDVLVTDVVMPGMGGAELVRQVRALIPGLPTVLISGYTEPEELAASGLAGFFVRKPFSPTALNRTIEAAMGAAAGDSADAPPRSVSA